MAQDFEQFLREVFGDSVNRLTQFQSGQMARLNSKLHDIAREALHEDLAKMATEITELRERVTVLESERAQKAADGI